VAATQQVAVVVEQVLLAARQVLMAALEARVPLLLLLELQ
jgi:hypothetical protein